MVEVVGREQGLLEVFWRILKLQERRREEIRSTVDQFDEKSGSTLKELSFIVKQEELKESQNIEQIIQLILKAKQALTILDIKSRYDISFQTLTNSLLPKASQRGGVSSFSFWGSASRDKCKQIWIFSNSLDSFSSITAFHLPPRQPSRFLPSARLPSSEGV